MSRHRHVRALNYNDEYDDDDDDYDEYGSYGDQYCVSPGTAAQFTYNRDNTSFQDYLLNEERERIPEENEEYDDADQLDTSFKYQLPPLSDEQYGQMLSCLDYVRDAVGDAMSEDLMKKCIVESNFDCEKSLNQILKQGSESPAQPKTKPPAGRDGLPMLSLSQSSICNSALKLTLRPQTDQRTLNLNLQSTQAALQTQSSGLRLTAPASSGIGLSLQNLDLNKLKLASKSLEDQKPVIDIKSSFNKLTLNTPQSQTTEMDRQKSNNNPGLNLTAALLLDKEHLISQPNTNEPSESSARPDEITTILIEGFNDSLDASLLASEPSHFAQLLCSVVQNQTLYQNDKFKYENQLSLTGSHVEMEIDEPENLNKIKRFQFNTPSPDDLIAEKQKKAFTKTPQSGNDLKPNISLSAPSSGKKSTVFHIGDKRSDKKQDEAAAAPDNSLIKPVKSTEKEPLKTPINTPLKNLIESESGRSSPAISRSSSKSRLERLDAELEYSKRCNEGKEQINLVVIGHVDAGKSTLMGHMLYKLGVVSQRQIHRYEVDSQKVGKASFMYAWVLDETEEERSRGVTMDVAQSRFETETKLVHLLDAPGHRDFIPNMITGAAQADCALLVVNSTNGEFETGFELGGQTREHTMLIRSLGVTQIVVAINKMDTVNWSQTRYLEICNKLSLFLKQVGFKDTDISYIPCSGLSGVNLSSTNTEVTELQWYKGPPLIELIDKFRPPPRLISKPLRICVQDIFKSITGGISLAGRIEAGDIQIGDKILVMPAGEPATVKALSVDDEPVKIGFAGDYVILQLTGLNIQKVHTGSVLCDPVNPIPVVHKFGARVVVFNIDRPITKGTPVIVHYQSSNDPAFITRLISQLNKNTGEVVKSKPRCLTKNTSAMVEITFNRSQCLELYKDMKDLGRFMLRSEGHTIAAGQVTEILQYDKKEADP